MNIHEYQAKQFLREYGIPVLDGRIIYKAEEAKTAAGELDGPLWVIKAQIHAGGRGKGKFIEESAGVEGGVRLAMFQMFYKLLPLHHETYEMFQNQLYRQQY